MCLTYSSAVPSYMRCLMLGYQPLDFRTDRTNKLIINDLPEKIAIVFAGSEFDGAICQCE